jgi:predicted nucleic acid-binding protein
MAAVSNCSPLRYFIAIGRVHLLPQVLGSITIPAAVLHELSHPSAPESVRTWLAKPPEWFRVGILTTHVDARLSEILDPGESEAIQLALELQTNFILIDERKGRGEAERRGLKVIGALGVLLEAHRVGILADPLEALNDLRAQGFRVSLRLIDEFRRTIAR